MTARGQKRYREPWRDVLDEFIEEAGKSNGKPKAATRTDSADDALEVARTGRPHGLDKVVDVDDRGRKYEVDQAPLVTGDDGDDNPQYAQPKPRIVTDKLGTDRNGKRKDITKPDQIVYPVQPKADSVNNPVGELLASGHGFMVDERRSRQWKTAKRTHCKFCGNELPGPDVSKYRCEFETPFAACKCAGCKLQELVATGKERNVGGPRKYCSKQCSTSADNERRNWRRAVERAEQRGEEPPPEPEDRGLKFVLRTGPRSSAEGTGHRYVAAVGLPWKAPRA